MFKQDINQHHDAEKAGDGHNHREPAAAGLAGPERTRVWKQAAPVRSASSQKAEEKM